MTLSKNPYKGTRDFFPSDKRIQDYLFKKMRSVAESFAFEPYDGPLIEEVELYKAKSGEELINEQIYSFYDRGKRFVAIRPEMTPTLARMIAQVHREVTKPIRWYSIPNLMRYERPQKGRLREHWQLNCDIFGAPENIGEIEIFQLLISLFNSFGADHKHFEIKLNDRRIVDEIITKVFNLSDEKKYRLYKIIDKCKKISEEDLNYEIKNLGLSTEHQEQFSEYLKLDDFEKLTLFLKKNQLENSYKNISPLIEMIKKLDLNHYISYDSTIVRGLDYYTGTVFEVYDKHPENRRALCGGGSYANLLKIFDELPVTGIGFGLGDVTLKDFLTIHQLLPDLSRPSTHFLITIQEERATGLALTLSNNLRSLGYSVNFHPIVLKFNKVFPLAEKKGAEYVGLIGERELENNSIQIKNMKTKEIFTLRASHLKADMLSISQP